MKLSVAGSKSSASGVAGVDTAEHRRVLIGLLLAGAVVVAIAAFEIWEGMRFAQLERTVADERTAVGIAAELAQTLQREDARLRTLANSSALRPLLQAAPNSPTALAAAEAELARRLPAMIDLRVVAESPDAAGIPTQLLSEAGRLVLDSLLVLDDSALRLRRECGEACRPLAPAGINAYLSRGDERWRLPTAGLAGTEGEAMPPSGTATAADPAHEPLAQRPPTAVAAIPYAGAAAWRVSVRQPTGFAALPSLAAALLLVALTAFGGWRLWFWSRRREAALIRDHQRLTASRRKLEAVLDSTTDGIVMVDARDRIALLNPAAEVMFGRLEADVLGTSVSTLLPWLNLESAQPGTTHPGHSPNVYEIRASRSGTDPFPARIAERHLLLDDEPHRLLLVQDLTEQERQAQQMEFLEQRDVISGLLNRTEFERRMARMLADAVGSDTPHVLCYIDIDQFKVINDTVGHAAGDALIAQLAKIIEVKLAAAALVCRLGGDEFGALFAEHDEAEVLAICEDLMQTVRHFLFTWRERSFDVAISIGVTAFVPEHESPEIELAKADVACHMAKREGRDRVHVYSDSDASLIRHHGEMHLVSTISQALNSERFRLYAQPIMPLAGSALGRTHYEILVRMLDEQGALVSPDTFIPAAERYILMPAVDRWIIQQLFSTQQERLRKWHQQHPGEFLYAVNLSGTSVSDEAFLPYLKRQFEVYDVPPASICFEVTETAAMRDFGHARTFMACLTELGCTFALDDFGSGLSSYRYLRELPVSYLKIDGSFVRDMHTDPVNHALVSSINQVAHVLGLKTIAEWAENEFIVNQLRALNVDFVQGFAIGTPLPVADCDPAIADGVNLQTEHA